MGQVGRRTTRALWLGLLYWRQRVGHGLYGGFGHGLVHVLVGWIMALLVNGGCCELVNALCIMSTLWWRLSEAHQKKASEADVQEGIKDGTGRSHMAKAFWCGVQSNRMRCVKQVYAVGCVGLPWCIYAISNWCNEMWWKKTIGGWRDRWFCQHRRRIVSPGVSMAFAVWVGGFLECCCKPHISMRLIWLQKGCTFHAPPIPASVWRVSA